MLPHATCRIISHFANKQIYIKPPVKPCMAGIRSSRDRFALTIKPRYDFSIEIQAIQSQQHPNDEDFHVEIACNGKKGKLFPDRVTSKMRDAVLIDGSDEFISLGAFAKMADPDKYATSKTYKNMVRVLPYRLPDGTMSEEQGINKFMNPDIPRHKTVRVGWDEEERVKVLKMRNEGLSQKQVAEELNVGVDAIKKVWMREFSKEHGPWRP